MSQHKYKWMSQREYKWMGLDGWSLGEVRYREAYAVNNDGKGEGEADERNLSRG